MRVPVIVIAALAGAMPAAAAITDLHFHGFGQVTYSNPDTEMDISGPAAGTPFEVFINVHLGTATGDLEAGFAPAPPDGFTGHFSVPDDAVFYNYVTFGWSLGPAGGASSLDPAHDFSLAEFDFVNGRVTQFTLAYVGDPDGHSIGAVGLNGGFSEDLGYYSPANWGGTFLLDAAPVPEPAAWMLMTAGFGLAGAAVRRRRSATA